LIHPAWVQRQVRGYVHELEQVRKIQDKIKGFVCAHSSIPEKTYNDLLNARNEDAGEPGTLLSAEEAVEQGVIGAVGGLKDALAWVRMHIVEGNGGG